MPAKKSPGLNHFPLKLHELLNDAEQLGHSHVICWCPDGQSFRINDPKALVPILHKYFRQTKYKSLLRQLQGYNFKRVTGGINKGYVSHPLFRRGMRSMCSQMKRKQNKASANASTNASPKASSVNGNTVNKDAKSDKNPAGDHRRRQIQQTSGMDALRVEIGCTFSSSKKVNHNVTSTISMSSLKRKSQEQLRPLVVQSSKSEPTIPERERLSKRQRIPDGVRSCNSSGLIPSSKNASFSFSRRVSKDFEDKTILANEMMQFQKIQQEKQKQKEFERLEKLCFSNVSQVPGTQQFHHSHNSTSAFGALDLDISLTTTTTTHYNGGDSQVSSSTISKNFVFPTDLEPTPILSPRRESKASSGITLSYNIDFPSEPENTNNQKIHQDIVVKLPPAPKPFDITSAECTSVVGDSSFGLSSKESDEIDDNIAETFGENVDTNGCSPVVFDTDVEGQNKEDEEDDWTKGVVYGGKVDCVLEPDKFQIEVHRLQFGKPHQQVSPQKQIGLQQSSRLEHNILQRQLQQQQTMMQQQGSHNIPPQPFQVPHRRILPCQQPRHLQMNARYALLSRPIPFGNDALHRQIQSIKR